MLLAAGVSVDKPLLPTIFRVGHLNDCTFSLLEKYLHPDSLPQPSSQLLIDIAARAAQFSSWSGACQIPREELMLVSLGKAAWVSRSAMFHCQGYTLQVELPSAVAKGKLHLTVASMHSRIILVCREAFARTYSQVLFVYLHKHNCCFCVDVLITHVIFMQKQVVVSTS